MKDGQEDFDKYKDLVKENSSRKIAKEKLERVQEDLNWTVGNDEETRKRDEVRATYVVTFFIRYGSLLEMQIRV